MIEVGISAIGTSVPAKILTNNYFEKKVDTSDEWITTRTGIKERRVLENDELLLTHVNKAVQKACERGGFSGAAMDFVISSTLTPDRICPAQSYEIANHLTAKNAFCFDLNAACSGFIYGLATAESFLKTRSVRTGLVTAGEAMSRLTNYQDRSSCILFGDAATAVVVTNQNPEHLLIKTELGAIPELAEEVIVGGVRDLQQQNLDQFYFRQNGRTVFKFAVNTIVERFKSITEQSGIKPEEIRYIIPHQANIRIIEAAAKNLGCHQAEFITNIEKYGNTSSASIGLAFEEAWPRFQKGDYIMLVGFGAGLSWAAALIQW